MIFLEYEMQKKDGFASQFSWIFIKKLSVYVLHLHNAKLVTFKKLFGDDELTIFRRFMYPGIDLCRMLKIFQITLY